MTSHDFPFAGNFTDLVLFSKPIEVVWTNQMIYVKIWAENHDHFLSKIQNKR